MAQTVLLNQEDKSVIAGVAGQYLTFSLGSECFGFEILKVQEIIGLMNITKIPKTPDYVKGVINLRGKVVSVIDLRTKFGLNESEHTDKTVIIVLQVDSKDSAEKVGLLVDEVDEVVNITPDMLQGTPELGIEEDSTFIQAMAKIGQRVVMLLDAGEVLTGKDLELLKKA